MGSNPTRSTNFKKDSEDMNYKREQSDDLLEAERLFNLGYRQTSNKFRIVARIDVPDVAKALKKVLPGASIGKWNRHDMERQWRRCYSKDNLEGVDEPIMRLLRHMDDAESGLRHRVCDIVVAVDVVGMEDKFDKGVEYVSLGVHNDMIYVYDKCGSLQQYMPFRFEKVEVKK